jgi:hypothetical protein
VNSVLTPEGEIDLNEGDWQVDGEPVKPPLVRFRSPRPEQIVRERVRTNSYGFPEAQRQDGSPYTKQDRETRRTVNRLRNKMASASQRKNR